MLNALKFEIMIFKNGGRVTVYLWRWREKTMKTVKEWKYLDILRSSGALPEHIHQIKRRQWSTGERKFKRNFN